MDRIQEDENLYGNTHDVRLRPGELVLVHWNEGTGEERQELLSYSRDRLLNGADRELRDEVEKLRTALRRVEGERDAAVRKLAHHPAPVFVSTEVECNEMLESEVVAVRMELQALKRLRDGLILRFPQVAKEFSLFPQLETVQARHDEG